MAGLGAELLDAGNFTVLRYSYRGYAEDWGSGYLRAQIPGYICETLSWYNQSAHVEAGIFVFDAS